MTDEKEKTKTTYVILSSFDEQTWKVEGEQAATSKASALSHFYEDRPMPEEDQGDPEQLEMPEAEDSPPPPRDPLFQAIPTSNWKAHRPRDPRPKIPFAEIS